LKSAFMMPGEMLKKTKLKADDSNPPAKKARMEKQEPILSTPPPVPETHNMLWVDKYKPKTLKQLIGEGNEAQGPYSKDFLIAGQQGDKSNAKKLILWIQTWSKFHNTPGVKPPPRFIKTHYPIKYPTCSGRRLG